MLNINTKVQILTILGLLSPTFGTLIELTDTKYNFNESFAFIIFISKLQP